MPTALAKNGKEQARLLPEHFIGVGEVRDFSFRQIRKSDAAYVYEVTIDVGVIRYEVVKRREMRSKYTGQLIEVYPSSKVFGIHGWAYNNLQDAENKFNTIKSRKDGKD